MHHIKDKRLVLLLRHAHRNQMQGDHGNDLPITTEGEVAAKALGKRLNQWPIKEVITSPVLRCVQTAEAIVESFLCPAPLSCSTLLGAPGPFIADAELAGNHFLPTDPTLPYQQLFQGITPKGMRPFSQGISLFFKFMQDSPKSVRLMITHDFLLTALGVFFFSEKQRELLWPDFLELLLLSYDDHEIQCTYKGATKKLLWDEIRLS